MKGVALEVRTLKSGDKMDVFFRDDTFFQQGFHAGEAPVVRVKVELPTPQCVLDAPCEITDGLYPLPIDATGRLRDLFGPADRIPASWGLVRCFDRVIRHVVV